MDAHVKNSMIMMPGMKVIIAGVENGLNEILL